MTTPTLIKSLASEVCPGGAIWRAINSQSGKSAGRAWYYADTEQGRAILAKERAA